MVDGARTSLGGDDDKNSNIAAPCRGGQAGESLDFGAQLLGLTSWVLWTRGSPL